MDEHEPEEKLVGRFKRVVLKARILQECKKRRFYETFQNKKKRKTREAAKKNRKRPSQPKTSEETKQEVPKKKKDDDKDDNWELPGNGVTGEDPGHPVTPREDHGSNEIKPGFVLPKPWH